MSQWVVDRVYNILTILEKYVDILEVLTVALTYILTVFFRCNSTCLAGLSKLDPCAAWYLELV